jgi:hypothetical protein
MTNFHKGGRCYLIRSTKRIPKLHLPPYGQPYINITCLLVSNILYSIGPSDQERLSKGQFYKHTLKFFLRLTCTPLANEPEVELPSVPRGSRILPHSQILISTPLSDLDLYPNGGTLPRR